MRRELFFQIQIAVVSVICHKNEKFQGISKYGMFQVVCEKSCLLAKRILKKIFEQYDFWFLKKHFSLKRDLFLSRSNFCSRHLDGNLSPRLSFTHLLRRQNLSTVVLIVLDRDLNKFNCPASAHCSVKQRKKIK